jgi:hypothetical protein
MHRTFLYTIVVLLSPSTALASFTPGQTLDPNCLPSDPTCLVVHTTVVAANINATSATATSTFAGGFSVGSSTPWFSIDANTGWISLGKSTARAPLDFYNENGPGDGWGASDGTGILFTGGIVQMDGLMDMTAGAHASCTGGDCVAGGGPLLRGEANRWGNISNGASFTVDIGQARPIRAITWGTYWKDSLSGQFTAYTIDYSTDGTTWTNLVTVTNNTKSVVLHYVSPTISMRYVKITNTGTSGASISNLQILGYTLQNQYSDQPIGFVQTNWSGVSFGSGVTNAILRTTGAFGIGTSTMSDRLTVDSGSGGAKAAMFQNSAAAATSTTALASFGALDSAGIMRKTASVGGVITQLSTAAYQGALVFYTANNATPAERVRVDASGNVGIGTTSPAYKLDVTGNGHFTSLVDAANFVATSSIATSTFAGGLSVGTSQFVVQHATGNVGIGTTNPTTLLHVYGGAVTATLQSTTNTAQLDLTNTGTTARFQAANNDLAISLGGSERMRINSSGNVGIGTTSPVTVLHTYSGLYPTFETSSAGNSLFITAPSQNAAAISSEILFSTSPNVRSSASGLIRLQAIQTATTSVAADFAIGTNSGGNLSEKVRVTGQGNIGIGTSTPTAQLSTTGTVRFSNFGAGTLQTDANGNLSVSSDERLKNIQGTFARGLTEIELINPILYKWKPETGYDVSSTYAGFSAQNVQSAIPEAVGQDGHGYLTLQDRPLIAAAVNAIKSIAGISDDFRVHLIAWLGDASNGIGDLFVNSVHARQTICVDGDCLTKSDIHALLQLVQQQNGIGASTDSSPPESASPSDFVATSTSTDVTSDHSDNGTSTSTASTSTP